MRVCFLLLYVCIVVSGDKESEEEGNRKRIIEQLTRTRTYLLDDYHLVTRQIATDVYMYRSYRTVSVVFYPVMRDVSDARFTFQSEELHLNNIGRCTTNNAVPLFIVVRPKGLLKGGNVLIFHCGYCLGLTTLL